jgi:hypothetical protein
MKSDSVKIKVLYESILYKNLDYLLLDNVDDFNWELFFQRYNFDKSNIFESFINLGDTPINQSGSFKRKYEIVINKNLKFYVHVAVHLLSDIQNSLSSNLIGLNKDSESYKSLSNLIDITKLHPDSYMCNVYFEDSNNNINLTGSVGNYSLSVLRNVERCVKDVIHDKNLQKNIQIISFQVDKNESKRINLYKQFMHRSGFLSIFPNEILDQVSNNSYDKLYFTK